MFGSYDAGAPFWSTDSAEDYGVCGFGGSESVVGEWYAYGVDGSLKMVRDSKWAEGRAKVDVRLRGGALGS